MIAQQMVVRCSKCGRRFIRSMGGTQSTSRAFGLGASPLCVKCRYANSGGLPSGGILGDMFKKRKK